MTLQYTIICLVLLAVLIGVGIYALKEKYTDYQIIDYTKDGTVQHPTLLISYSLDQPNVAADLLEAINNIQTSIGSRVRIKPTVDEQVPPGYNGIFILLSSDDKLLLKKPYKDLSESVHFGPLSIAPSELPVVSIYCDDSVLDSFLVLYLPGVLLKFVDDVQQVLDYRAQFKLFYIKTNTPYVSVTLGTETRRFPFGHTNQTFIPELLKVPDMIQKALLK